MEWVKYILEIPAEEIETVYGILFSEGIDGIQIESNDCLTLDEEEKNWDYCDESKDIGNRIIFYSTKEDEKNVDATLKKVKDYALANGLNIGINKNSVFEQEWTEDWKKYFKPTRITEKIVIKPEWESYEPENTDDIIINIDPGMAFGTGTHETTSMCIELLEKYIIQGDTILDIGCGSGILSIAAARLGSERVVGIDIDETAVKVSLENVDKNNLSDRIHILHGDLIKNIVVKADIAVANIIADIIILLSKDVKNNLKGKKIFIMSGILIEKEKLVLDELTKNGFEILEIYEKGEWAAMAARYNHE